MWRKILTVAIAASPFALKAERFEYFNSEIDYWKENKKAQPSATPSAKPDAKLQQSEKSSAEVNFEWSKYLDPKSKEFFREGEYLPPEPFMELARNPTDENIRNWFAMIGKKNELTVRMSQRIEEYLAKNGKDMDVSAKNSLEQTKMSLKKAPDSVKRYRFRFYFDSHCPHCKRMFATVATLVSQGYYVEAFQVDAGGEIPMGLAIPATPSTKEDLEKHNVKSIPLLLVGDVEKKTVYRLSGYQSVDSIFSAIGEHEFKN